MHHNSHHQFITHDGTTLFYQRGRQHINLQKKPSYYFIGVMSTLNVWHTWLKS